MYFGGFSALVMHFEIYLAWPILTEWINHDSFGKNYYKSVMKYDRWQVNIKRGLRMVEYDVGVPFLLLNTEQWVGVQVFEQVESEGGF